MEFGFLWQWHSARKRTWANSTTLSIRHVPNFKWRHLWNESSDRLVLSDIVRDYVFTFFFKIPKTRLLTFFEVSCKKRKKNVESAVQVFTFLHFQIADGLFHCKTITHMSCYAYNIIFKTVHFWLQCIWPGIVRKTVADWGWLPWSSGL